MLTSFGNESYFTSTPFPLIGQVTIASQFSWGFLIIAKNLETKSKVYHSLPPNSPYLVVLLIIRQATAGTAHRRT